MMLSSWALNLSQEDSRYPPSRLYLFKTRATCTARFISRPTTRSTYPSNFSCKTGSMKTKSNSNYPRQTTTTALQKLTMSFRP